MVIRFERNLYLERPLAPGKKIHTSSSKVYKIPVTKSSTATPNPTPPNRGTFSPLPFLLKFSERIVWASYGKRGTGYI